MSSLRSLPPLGGIILFKTHEQQLTIAHSYVRACAYSFLVWRASPFTRGGRVWPARLIHSSPQATPPIDTEGCGLRDQRCCNVHPASFNQLAKETRYSRGSFARNSSRQKTPTTESPPSVKQSRTTSNPERCSFVAFEPPEAYLSISIFFRTLLTRLL